MLRFCCVSYLNKYCLIPAFVVLQYHGLCLIVNYFSGSDETVCGVKVESPLFPQAPSPFQEECDLKNSDNEEEHVTETVKSR
jgi:hypothetical protein